MLPAVVPCRKSAIWYYQNRVAERPDCTAIKSGRHQGRTPWRIIAPRDNRRDLEEIPAKARKDMTFTFVEHMDQVLNAALKREVQPERPSVEPLRRRSTKTRDGVAARAGG